MAAVLTVVNNSTAVSNGFYRPRFTMNVKGLDTRKRTLHLESAQFELHFENVDPSTNKLYVRTGDTEQQLDLLTGTYTNIEDLLSVINETLKNAKHQDIQFSYSRLSSRVSVTVPEGKTCTFSPLQPYTHRTQRLVWVPWCDSRNRASQYQIEAASWQRRADRMRAE